MEDNRPSWDEIFVSMCYLVAMRSPDMSTHVGAVIATVDNEIVSVGYNGLPRGVGCGDCTDAVGKPIRLSSQGGTKYRWTEHSERNAIYNAGRIGVPLLGRKLYVNFLPCSDCARGIIQSGIVEVITHEQGQEASISARGNGENTWKEDHDMVLGMLAEGGVSHRWFRCKILQPTAFFSGQEIEL